MIAKSSISANLRSLNTQFKRNKSPKLCLFYSKLAILELCGWTEESMDDMVLWYAKKHLKNDVNINYIKKEVVGKTYGFDYAKHFRKMLSQVVGMVNFEKVERKVDQIKKVKLASTLNSLKQIRDKEAHTHVKGTTRVINSPSITITQFDDVYAGLKEFERIVRTLPI